MEEVNNNLQSARAELQLQGPLIIALTHKIAALEDDLRNTQVKCKQEIESLERQYESEKQHIVLSRDQQQDEQRLALARRAMIAETELEKVKKQHATRATSSLHITAEQVIPRGEDMQLLVAKTEKLTTALEESNKEVQEVRNQAEKLKHEKQKLQDEVNYLREENTRLERQVCLIKQDLDAFTVSTPQSANATNNATHKRK